jgi:hypothetical protein
LLIGVCLTFLAFRVETYMHCWEMMNSEGSPGS